MGDVSTEEKVSIPLQACSMDTHNDANMTIVGAAAAVSKWWQNGQPLKAPQQSTAPIIQHTYAFVML